MAWAASARRGQADGRTVDGDAAVDEVELLGAEVTVALRRGRELRDSEENADERDDDGDDADWTCQRAMSEIGRTDDEDPLPAGNRGGRLQPEEV